MARPSLILVFGFTLLFLIILFFQLHDTINSSILIESPILAKNKKFKIVTNQYSSVSTLITYFLK